MKYEISLSSLDEEHYSEDIPFLLDSISPIIEKFYKRFNATVVWISYNSTISFHTETKIRLGIECSQMYPELSIDINRAGSAFLKPSERIFEGVLFVRNIDKSFLNDMFEKKGITGMLIAKAEDKSPSVKVNDLILNGETIIKEWNDIAIASEVFVF